MIRNIRILAGILGTAIFCFSSCQPTGFKSLRKNIDLSGEWQFALDSAGSGIQNNLPVISFSDKINLPGTLDENKKGYPVTTIETGHLSRKYRYVGAAWFRKKIVIPGDWKDMHIRLCLERTKVTKVWIDKKYIGTSGILSVAQCYDLTESLTPGEHTLSIQVNNDPKLVPVGGSHAYSDETQTNWNGIIGKIFIEASDKNCLKSIKVLPDVALKKADVNLVIANPSNIQVDGFIRISAEAFNTSLKHEVEAKDYPVSLKTGSDAHVHLIYSL